jgi:hypothetical protein
MIVSQIVEEFAEKVAAEKVREERNSIALNMLKAGKYAMEEISDITGLTLQEVQKLTDQNVFGKHEEHIILSERPEDIKKSGDWIQKQMERQERNRQIGDKSWKRILPVIRLPEKLTKKMKL